MRSAFSLATLCVVGLVATLCAAGSPLSIFGTGVDVNGNPLPQGSVDPHWAITLGGGPQAFVSQGATVAEASHFGVPVGWPLTGGAYTNPSNSAPPAQWIGPIPDILSMTETMDTEFDYTTTFDTTGFNLSTLQINGLFSSDNQTIGVYLNGALIPGTTIAGNPPGFQFQMLTPFSLTSGFVTGANTLSVHTLNKNTGDPNPSGLIVQLSSNATSLPEPGTLALFVTGLPLVWFAYRHRR